MNPLLSDKRLAFYLEHRDDIREWAAIERDVTRAVRDLLRDSQAEFERRLRELEPEATTIRLDYLRWERIMLRRPSWPAELGIAVEWEPKSVDPFGGSLPKIGVFFTTKQAGQGEIRSQLLERCGQAGGFAQLGFGLGVESVWPVLKSAPKSKDWWQDPDAWIEAIMSDAIKLWGKAAPLIDHTVAEPPRK